MVKKQTVILLAAVLLAVIITGGCINGSEVAENDTVSVRYVGTFENGTVFDSNTGDDGKEPLQFIVGKQQVISGFEKAVIGMKPNETKTVTLPTEEAYPYDPSRVVAFNKTEVVESLGSIPEVGHKLTLLNGNGGNMVGTVLEITDTEVIIDFNGETAGKTLIFKITVVDVIKSGNN
ncbi:MAG: FKBP-type peptidyl-prolyl cis-trans isomerase [Methanosarcinales archaeon]|jgi:FKBP-type peptidyl-prolyl cis-trans isomerase 2|nr:FKBP-type peptidyl-prolyl cis-trans isomerase [Methanosarcinales archaeon]